ncbi:MAG: hydrogenase expression protein HupH [Emergencia sp.]|jgi:allantoin racemase|nr:hydrogenase expression protein HupH [Emergencia sp.]
MKLLNLPPIIDNRFGSEEMKAYMMKYLLPGTEMDTWYLEYGPGSIEGEFDEALAAANVVLKCMEAEKAGYDGIFVNCFGDPGVRAARETVKIPVFGGFEPIVHYALGTADKLGIVTVLPEVVPMIEGQIAKSGFEKRFTKVRHVDIPVLDLGELDDLIQAVIEESKRAIKEDGAGTIILGCTAMAGVKEAVEKALCAEGYGVPVIEAAQAAVVMLETFVRMDLYHSRVTYMPPRDKARMLWTGGDETAQSQKMI